MIRLIDVCKGVLMVLVFVIALRAIQNRIDYKKSSQKHFRKTSQVKYKIMMTTIVMFILIAIVYNFQCRTNPTGSIGLLQCIYITPNRQLASHVAKAFYINTTLYLGGLRQELYNGRIRKKFMRLYKKQFQWSLFKKLFIVPLCLEVVYRSLICRLVDPNLQHPSFFTFFSGFLYAFSHLINYFSLRNKFSASFAIKTLSIQIIYTLLFGLYISHIFSKSPALISSLVIQVYANFMGYPDYFEVLRGNVLDDQQVRKIGLFYFFGIMSCFVCCLYL